MNNEGITELWKVIEEYRDRMSVRKYLLHSSGKILRQPYALPPI